MASATHLLHQFEHGLVYGLDKTQNEKFASQLSKDLGYPVTVAASAEEACREADVIFTQTTGSQQVLKLEWLKPHCTIIASGSDQPTKNELPSDVMKKSKFVTDLTRQCARVGELRTAIKEGVMKEEDVYSEIGDVISGKKKGREGTELIVVDLTGTGAQDAAIGGTAWEMLHKL